MAYLRRQTRQIITRIGGFDVPAEVEDDPYPERGEPSIEKLRESSDRFDAMVARRYGSDFLRDMILAKEPSDEH